MFSKNAFKSIFASKRKPSIDKKDIKYTEIDQLEAFIKEKQIKCFAYSDFESIQLIERENSTTLKRAILEDKFFVLKSFSNNGETIRKVISEVFMLSASIK
jgi:hypothetical protein